MRDRYELNKFLAREKISVKTLQDEIYDYLEKNILAGNIPPNTVLSEIELSRIFDTSRSVIRESIIKLAEAGLVVKESYKSARVRNLTEKDVRELFDVRLALELLAIEKIEDFTYSDYTFLKQFIPDYETDSFSYISLDREFHEKLISMARNDTLLSLYLRIKSQVQLVMSYMLKKYPGRKLRVNKEHLSIIDALLKGEKNSAIELMRHHIESAKEETIGWIREDTSEKEVIYKG